ncbi:putative deoxyribonuclease YjjV [Marinomonas aquimarina]|uniref:Putative deoxyribonuclease YjjV n=1 Tax=Marinomonas aquimarina TaxID=295068 RepID=A0A1A8T0R8_9GAMM|nr:TatD family hydrolase [Marinomonas aquimarina]SBS25161.1 putative deoxyribonuclease YjjV [Marinomonas aquimarina]
MFIDSHCHLDFPVFDALADLITQSQAAGIDAFLVPGTTSESWAGVLALQHEYSAIKVALGLHPYFLQSYQASDLQQLASLLAQYTVVAVGEIGLDKWPNLPDYQLQQEVFVAQLAIATEQALPVILHARKSEDDLLKLLRQSRFTHGGIVHAFNGSLEQAKRFLDLGFVLGIGGTVTYPRAQKARRVLQALSDSDYVLETDSPDMPVCGYQGQANSPLRILDIAHTVSELRQQSVLEIAHHTSANLQRVLPNWHKVKN